MLPMVNKCQASRTIYRFKWIILRNNKICSNAPSYHWHILQNFKCFTTINKQNIWNELYCLIPCWCCVYLETLNGGLKNKQLNVCRGRSIRFGLKDRSNKLIENTERGKRDGYSWRSIVVRFSTWIHSVRPGRGRNKLIVRYLHSDVQIYCLKFSFIFFLKIKTLARTQPN